MFNNVQVSSFRTAQDLELAVKSKSECYHDRWLVRITSVWTQAWFRKSSNGESWSPTDHNLYIQIQVVERCCGIGSDRDCQGEVSGMCPELLNSKRLKEGDRVLLRVVPWKVGMVVGDGLATETLETPSIPSRIFTLDCILPIWKYP